MPPVSLQRELPLFDDGSGGVRAKKVENGEGDSKRDDLAEDPMEEPIAWAGAIREPVAGAGPMRVSTVGELPTDVISSTSAGRSPRTGRARGIKLTGEAAHLRVKAVRCPVTERKARTKKARRNIIPPNLLSLERLDVTCPKTCRVARLGRAEQESRQQKPSNWRAGQDDRHDSYSI